MKLIFRKIGITLILIIGFPFMLIAAIYLIWSGKNYQKLLTYTKKTTNIKIGESATSSVTYITKDQKTEALDEDNKLVEKHKKKLVN